MATDKLAQQGYEEALWAAVYLQSTKGRQVFGKLFCGLPPQASADQVIRSELGMTPAQLDQKLVEWGRSGKVPIFEAPSRR